MRYVQITIGQENCSSPGARILVNQSQCSLRMYSVVLLIVGRLDLDGQSFALIGLHESDAASDWLLIKRDCIGTKACRESSYKINRRDFSINWKDDVNLPFKNQRSLRKIQKTSSGPY